MLANNEPLYKQTAAIVGDVLFVIDPEQHSIEWFGDAGFLWLGYNEGELKLSLEALPRLVIEEDAAKLSSTINSLLSGTRARTDIRLREKNGSYHWIQLAGGPLLDEKGALVGITGILRDTEPLHRALMSLSEARRMKTIGSMAGGIAHEFNNHLTPIGGYIELAIDELGPNHVLTEGLQTALDRVKHCANLVSQIQAYGRQSTLLPSRVDVASVTSATTRLALSAYLADSEQIKIEEDLPKSLPYIWVDPSKFHEALVHLIRNAIEAMPTGGTLTISATEINIPPPHVIKKYGSELSQHGFVCIRISDTGCGIDPENRDSIFDPFFTTRSRAEARGMGLPMVQGMVEQHAGWMDLSSEVGRGTTVELYLPIADPANIPSVPIDEDGTMAVQPAAAPGRLLLADDESSIRHLLFRVFELEGWEVDEAENYTQVLESIEKHPTAYSLYILDITMPGGTTEEAIVALRQHNPSARVLFISGGVRDERIERLVQMIPSDFVGKPFSPQALVEKVDKLLSR